MRYGIAFVALLGITSTAAAIVPADPYRPVFDHAIVLPRVGETVRVRVSTTGSGYAGIQSEQYFLPWNFASDDEGVALVEGRLDDPVAGTTIRVTGVNPGWASIRFRRWNGGLWYTRHLEILVTCGPDEPVRVAEPVLRTRVGNPVTLRAIAEHPANTVFRWYAGRLGDMSRLLPVTAAEIPFTPTSPGEHYVWVSATTPCSTSSAEMRIDAAGVRRRAVR